MNRIWRALFEIVATVGRPLGGIPPRRITLWLAREAYGADNPAPHEYRWTAGRDGLEFFLHPHFVNDVQLIAFGSYDPSLEKLIDAKVKPGMVCVDVGANLGLVALHMAQKVGPAGRVYAFEPVPLLFKKLRLHVVRNHLEATVDARLCAVSNRSGRAAIHTHDERERNQGLALLVGSVGDQERDIEVDCTSLDDFADRERLQRMDFVKIDVQGAEALVLEGARESLERFGPEVVLELSSGLSPLARSPESTVELMEKAGYAVFELRAGSVGRRLNPSNLSAGFSALNVYCCKRR